MPRTSGRTKGPKMGPARGRKQTIAFGMVNVPVRLGALVASAAQSTMTRNIICVEHQQKIKTQAYCEVGDHVLDADEKQAAFPVANGYVILDDDVLEALVEEKTGELRIDRVVEVGSIDPGYVSKSFLVWPDEGGSAAFDLFAAAMQEAGLAAVGTATMGKQTELVILRWSEHFGTLLAHTCHYDERVKWNDVETILEAATGRPDPAVEQVELAVDYLKALKGSFEPEAVEDRYTAEVRKLVEQAAGGAVLSAPAPKQQAVTPVDDLMAALRQSVSAAKGSGKSAGAKKAAAAKPTGKKKAVKS